jgi:hypothetical protein
LRLKQIPVPGFIFGAIFKSFGSGRGGFKKRRPGKFRVLEGFGRGKFYVHGRNFVGIFVVTMLPVPPFILDGSRNLSKNAPLASTIRGSKQPDTTNAPRV